MAYKIIKKSCGSSSAMFFVPCSSVNVYTIGSYEQHAFNANMVNGDVIKEKHFHVTGHLCGEFPDTGELPA